jgi:hypothetical protein
MRVSLVYDDANQAVRCVDAAASSDVVFALARRPLVAMRSMDTAPRVRDQSGATESWAEPAAPA